MYAPPPQINMYSRPYTKVFQGRVVVCLHNANGRERLTRNAVDTWLHAGVRAVMRGVL